MEIIWKYFGNLEKKSGNLGGDVKIWRKKQKFRENLEILKNFGNMKKIWKFRKKQK